MASASYEEAKQFLLQDRNGVNLYDHLSEVLLKILIEKPNDAVDMFEHISTLVKQGSFKPADGEGKAIQQNPIAKKAQLDWASQSLATFKVAADAEPEGEPEGLQDLVDEANALEWAGVGLGRSFMFRLFMRMKQLATPGLTPNPIRNLRFWGKIMTRGRDYIVLEGVQEDDNEGDEIPGQEGRRGANKSNYFVMYEDDLSTVIKLPNVTQAQLVASRQIKKFFTGDLDAEVSGYPPFPGTEKNYLRAQIARITSACTIVPKDFFVPSEDDELQIQPNEPENLPEYGAADLEDVANWSHLELEINVRGRQTVEVAVDPETGEEMEDPDAPEQVPALRTLDEEAGDWAPRLCPSSGGPSSTAVCVIRALRWPGANSVAFGRRFANVYVGFGQRFSQTTYTPPSLPALQTEQKESSLKEHKDLLEDPTPPVVEEEGEEEEDE